MNRSLSRGLAILECFRPGIGSLTHRDIAEITGLPKPTLTRLIQTLRFEGYLVVDHVTGGYRLGMPILSLARTLTLSSKLERWIRPVITKIAFETQSIIGFGTGHGTDIVYLSAVNGDPKRPDRCVGPGMRAPMLFTSVGRAYLAGLPIDERTIMLNQLRSTSMWKPALKRELCSAFRQFKREGFCLIERSCGQQVAVGISIHLKAETLYAMGIGYRVAKQNDATVVPKNILEAISEIRNSIDRFENTY